MSPSEPGHTGGRRGCAEPKLLNDGHAANQAEHHIQAVPNKKSITAD